ncbi:MAG: hypothetical protein V3T86_05495 [Planctomycetota bacterium]
MRNLRNIVIVAVVAAVIVAFITTEHGMGVMHADTDDHPHLWRKYVGYNGQNGALNVGRPVGDYLTAIKTRATNDTGLAAGLKTNIKNRCDALKAAYFGAYTKDETYVIIVIAERHSALNHWEQVWKRLQGAVGAAGWAAAYKPTDQKLGGYNKNVEVLLGAVKSKFPSHATIPGRCDERIQYPHTSANRNTSWARILLAFELANDTANAGQVDMELDHPEATTN